MNNRFANEALGSVLGIETLLWVAHRKWRLVKAIPLHQQHGSISHWRHVRVRCCIIVPVLSASQPASPASSLSLSILQVDVWIIPHHLPVTDITPLSDWRRWRRRPSIRRASSPLLHHSWSILLTISYNPPRSSALLTRTRCQGNFVSEYMCSASTAAVSYHSFYGLRRYCQSRSPKDNSIVISNVYNESIIL